MKRRLLYAACLTLVSAGASHAQYTLVGQTAGTAAVTLTPAITLSGQVTGSSNGQQRHSLDFDNDGLVDMTISATTSGSMYSQQTADVIVRDSNVQLYSNPPTGLFGYSCLALANGDTLQPIMHRRNAAGALGNWSSASSTNPSLNITVYNPILFSGFGNTPGGQFSGGDWFDLQVHYAGFRLRANSTAPWRYGWIRLQTTSNNPVTINIQAYALATTALSLPSARAAGWQVYPTVVDDQLTLEPPASGGRGQLVVQDLCGRPVQQMVLSGNRQQINLVGLAAGVYVVQLDTPAGHFMQRIVKQ